MKKRHLLSGVMALLVSVALSACGGDKNAGGTSAERRNRKLPQKKPVILFQKEHQYQAEVLYSV